ncbi:MAG: hypothetical protein ABIT20_18820 [Gemmatimonadaceae bacterium]
MFAFVSPHRNFRDDDDREWSAWDVIPRRRGVRIALTPRLAHGWLAFESNDERRRLAPIPAEWHLMPEERLRALWRDAEALPPRRRLLE